MFGVYGEVVTVGDTEGHRVKWRTTEGLMLSA